ncbi:DUF2169 domain-containing protein [Pendulispora brunnea]|uniref:DUF2169 domain-containing protein n=1 Tax=Pendulispora brunnea TaxID=2905690 RepID=A0ABZ2K8U9_9BACT
MSDSDPKVSAYPLSAPDRNGAHALGVVAKRSYGVLSSGQCTPAPEEALLNFAPIDDPDHPDLIEEDSDLWPDKLLTDVVVRGHAWNHPRTLSFHAEVYLNRHLMKRVLVSGERRCFVNAGGQLAFTPPSLVDRVKLSYALAYGGEDRAAEERVGFPEQPFIELLAEDQRAAATVAASPYRYARNHAGRGFIIDATAEALEALALPQLEDPADRLTPERLIVHDPWHWPLQPLPASLDFLGHGMFPRIGWFGHTPDWDPQEIGHLSAHFPEFRLGHATTNIFDLSDEDFTKRFDRLAFQGASLGLRVGPLQGGEWLTLVNLHPSVPNWTLQLPVERPRLAVDDRQGGLTPLKARLQTVLVEPDRWRVTMVWAGFARALRPYLPQELARMPFQAQW